MYQLASITKPLTASLLLNYIKSGEVSLQDSVYQYVTDFPKDVTFKELLTHTSGFFRNKNYKSFKENSIYTEVVNYLPRRWKRNKKNKHRYTNINYSAIGAVIDSLSNASFSDEMKAEFYSTISDSSIYFTNDETPENLVKSYLQRYRRRYFHRPIEAGLWEPAALGATSPKVYSEYMRNILTDDFIKLVTSEKVLVKKRRLKGGQLYEEFYGLGFRLAYINGELSYIFHHGFIYGALSTFCYFPSYDIGYTALSNMSSFPKQRYPFARIIMKIVKKALNIDLASSKYTFFSDEKLPKTPNLFLR